MDLQKYVSDNNYSGYYWEYLHSNPKMDMGYLIGITNNGLYLSSNPNLTTEDITSHPEINWDYYKLMKRNLLDWDFVKNNRDKISDKIISRFMDFNILFSENIVLDRNGIAKNKNINLTILNICIDRDIICLDFIYKNPGLSYQEIINHPKIKPNYYALTKHPEINTFIVNQNPELDWNWDYISLRFHLYTEFIEKHKDMINWNNLSANKYINRTIIKKYKNYLHRETLENNYYVDPYLLPIVYNSKLPKLHSHPLRNDICMNPQYLYRNWMDKHPVYEMIKRKHKVYRDNVFLVLSNGLPQNIPQECIVHIISFI
jgi:hypothetical protein